MVELLPADKVGTCVLDSGGDLFRGDQDRLRQAIRDQRLLYHPGSIRGAFPQILPKQP